MTWPHRCCSRASRDPILTALAQNGALRLESDGAFVSLTQGPSARIVADATLSSWLCSAQPEPSPAQQAQQAQKESDIGRLVAQSVAVFSHAAPSTADRHNIVANHSRHMIRHVDSLKPSLNKAVQDSPSNTTSYAAVPIRSATGQLVGCYAVADEQIRDDFLTEHTYNVLADVALAIAKYLEQQHGQNLHVNHCSDAGLQQHGASHSDSTTSETSLSGAASFDDNTPLTTPSEAAGFAFNLQMPTNPMSTCPPPRQLAADPCDTLAPTDAQPQGHPSVSAEEMTKSDFVSSLSHELRSPLHGCLAAVELLQETNLDTTQKDLVGMVQACSSTLLYTLNHLLDYSKVNDLENVKSKHPNHVSTSQDAASHNTFGEASVDYLCRVAQDVIEGMHFGHTMQQAAYSKMQESPLGDHTESHLDPALLLDNAIGSTSATNPDTPDGVATFLYMDSSAAWFSMIHAGAWKRLIMNLFGNSLKFCFGGHIEVTLKMDPDQSDPNRCIAHLTVNDTGIGMSEEFMNQGLYQPFMQENHLTAGTGIGLNIVKRIVNEMQGTIKVNSTVGSGTRFDVFVPVIEPEAPSERSSPVLTGGQILDPQALLPGRNLCLLSSTIAASDTMKSRTSLVHSYVRSIAEDWYHMKVTTADMAADVEADFYIAEASDFIKHARSTAHSSQAALKQRTILIGTSSQLTEAKRETTGSFIGLSYPLGPRSLVRVLYAALERPEDLEYPAVITETTSDRMKVDPVYSQPKETTVSKEDFTHKNTTKQHLLLVDDNAINLKLLSTFVKKLKFPAETAVDGQDAFSKYKTWSTKQPFTTILMDISMPKMNGFESSRAVREFEAQHGLQPAKIIALTALSSEASRREAETSGIDDFQMKPVSLKTLKGLLPDAA